MKPRILLAFVANLHLAVMAFGTSNRSSDRPAVTLVVGLGGAEPIDWPELPRPEPILSLAILCPTTEFDPEFFDMGPGYHGVNLEYLWRHVRLCKTRLTAKQFNQRSGQRKKGFTRKVLSI